MLTRMNNTLINILLKCIENSVLSHKMWGNGMVLFKAGPT